MACLDILVVFTLVCQPIFHKSDQMISVAGGEPDQTSSGGKRKERWRAQVGLEQPHGVQVDSWLLGDKWSTWMLTIGWWFRQEKYAIGPFRQLSAWDTSFKPGLQADWEILGSSPTVIMLRQVTHDSAKLTELEGHLESSLLLHNRKWRPRKANDLALSNS